MGQVAELNEADFQGAVASGVVLLDFWATWCGPCRSLVAVLDQIASEFPDVKIFKINVEVCTQLASQYAVRTVPTLFVLRDGAIVNEFVGVQSKAALVEALQNA